MHYDVQVKCTDDIVTVISDNYIHTHSIYFLYYLNVYVCVSFVSTCLLCMYVCIYP